MKTSSAKEKGRRLQKRVKKLILESFPELEEDDVRSTPMGVNGEDVQLSPLARRKFPFATECKNQEGFGNAVMWNTLKQAKTNSEGHIPLVVFSKNYQDDYIILKLSDLMDLIKDKDTDMED